MKFTYPFGWLDELAEVIMNPEKNKALALTPDDLSHIRERLPGEFGNIRETLKNQTFALYSNEKIKVVAGHYDQAIRLLMQQMRINLALYPPEDLLRDTAQLLLDHLNEFSQSMHQRYQSTDGETSLADQPELQPIYKVLCRLSVDQIAIILKAADDIKLVISRSFSQVLKSIVPYLSTQRFENFSWKSARSSTYKMENNDKEAVIGILEALIRKVREYG
ncbi:hypothetical protein AAFN85_13830 [Mucilaginibacter sp. CAU 1740]|uniref:hypothetical protein n=1 Tax=Mucilaginibacter sp. CAU 1740 TaxID=3140365 RepID=UPI00325A649C